MPRWGAVLGCGLVWGEEQVRAGWRVGMWPVHDSMELCTQHVGCNTCCACAPRYEVLFHYGCVLMEGGEGLEADPARAAELLEEAAEEAGAAGKGKLAQRYYEKAAEAQGMCE